MVLLQNNQGLSQSMNLNFTPRPTNLYDRFIDYTTSLIDSSASIAPVSIEDYDWRSRPNHTRGLSFPRRDFSFRYPHSGYHVHESITVVYSPHFSFYSVPNVASKTWGFVEENGR